MELQTLQTIWFILIFVLLGGYAILDGFDLGVGILHLSGKSDGERRTGLQAIGPVWDGNEVWLLTGGGALFAAFPYVYATVFSAMYLALILVLVALIGRAVAIEFRSKEDAAGWRKFWDVVFSVCSLLAALLFGVAFGNVLNGMPLEGEANQIRFTGGFFDLLHPYCLGIGLLTVTLFTLHGSIYLAMKSRGAQQERMRKWIPIIWSVTVALYVVLSAVTMIRLPHLFDGPIGSPLFYVLLGVVFVSAIAVPVLGFGRRFGSALIASSAMIAGMMGLSALSLFPRLVPSSKSLESSLTAFGHSSSQHTLGVMLIIALIGMPFVIGYTAFIYRVFKGQIEVQSDGY